jgi:hypothetical protein
MGMMVKKEFHLQMMGNRRRNLWTSLVEKNEKSDTQWDGTKPKQMEGKKNSTSEGEVTIENQKKASDVEVAKYI